MRHVKSKSAKTLLKEANVAAIVLALLLLKVIGIEELFKKAGQRGSLGCQKKLGSEKPQGPVGLDNKKTILSFYLVQHLHSPP